MKSCLMAFVISVAATATAYAQSDLANIGCTAEKSLRSADGKKATTVTFRNNSSRTVRTYWLDYQGKRVAYERIRPGGEHKQDTYVTHPWVITADGSNDCVAIFIPESSNGAAVIR